MSSDIDTAFDGPWIEPVPGFGDVAFARSDMDYWGSLANRGSLVSQGLQVFRVQPAYQVAPD